jgi:DNA-binding transcriptional ArsR family regulator
MVLNLVSDKEWVRIFKALGNLNRLRIIRYLHPHGKEAVGMIAEHIRLSPKSTSKHLIHLERLGILESEGKDGRVFYSINSRVKLPIKEVLNIIFR